MRGICEVCDRPFAHRDLEDGVTRTADCCERAGLCARCRKPGEHDCDERTAPADPHEDRT